MTEMRITCRLSTTHPLAQICLATATVPRACSLLKGFKAHAHNPSWLHECWGLSIDFALLSTLQLNMWSHISWRVKSLSVTGLLSRVTAARRHVLTYASQISLCNPGIGLRFRARLTATNKSLFQSYSPGLAQMTSLVARPMLTKFPFFFYPALLRLTLDIQEGYCVQSLTTYKDFACLACNICDTII